MFTHFSSPKSLIFDVLRAIVSRPTSHAIFTGRLSPRIFTSHRIESTSRSYSTLGNSLEEDILKAYDNGKSKSTGKKRSVPYIPVVKKGTNGEKITVNGYTLKKKKEKPTNIEEYNRRIMFAVKDNKINKATKILREVEESNIKTNVQTYSIIVHGFCKQLDLFRARKWLDRMLRRSIKPNVFVYTSLIDGFMRSANISKAEDMFRLMMKRNIQPSLVTYNVLMHNSIRQLDIESALKFWGNLLQAGLKADAYTYAIILHGLGEESRIDEAWNLFGLMKEEGIVANEVVITTLMGMHVKHKDNEYAVQLFKDFFESKTELKLVPTPHTRNVLLNATISSTDLETIKKVYNQYIHTLENPKQTESLYFVGANILTYTTFMRAFLRHNDLFMVGQVYEDMKKRNIQPTIVTYSTLMLAHAYVPDPVSCQNIFNELKKGGIEVNVAIYTILMRAWAKSGNREMVKSVYKEMKNDNIKPNKYTMEVLRWGSNDINSWS
ncbi:hypothetical protein BY458DRAFT_496931 [Sporodiniella umbellata]|nr:hypothetical protein BY458DRAFT_496931 [Sporodiniella umbellata]